MISDVLFEARESISEYMDEFKAYRKNPEFVAAVANLLDHMAGLQLVLDTHPSASEEAFRQFLAKWPNPTRLTGA